MARYSKGSSLSTRDLEMVFLQSIYAITRYHRKDFRLIGPTSRDLTCFRGKEAAGITASEGPGLLSKLIVSFHSPTRVLKQHLNSSRPRSPEFRH